MVVCNLLNYFKYGLQRIVAMKTKNLKTKKIMMLGTAIVSLNSLNAIQAQAATGAVSALATIIQAISVSSVSALHFGRLIPGTAGGNATITTTTGAQTLTGTVVDASGAGVVQQGIVKITGASGVAIDLTVSATNNLAGPGPAMVLSNINLETDAGGTARTITLPAASSADFSIGGQIVVGTDVLQTVGAYAGSIVIAANYQ